jgi:hypothetical protein
VRHPARSGVCGLAVLILGAVLSAQPVSAAPPAGPTSVIAGHGLGARPSTLPGAMSATTSVRSAGVGTSALAALPARVDLTKWAMTPGNQGSVNSCVPWAIDYALLGWYSRYTGLVGAPFAPMYTYSQINGGGDWGSEPATALQLAVTQGNDTRADYSPGDTDWKTLPTKSQRTNAARFRIKAFTVLFAAANRPGNSTSLQQALAANHPVAITLAVRHGFDYLAKGATATDTDTTSAIRGNHEVLALGYDATGLIVQNSWGTGWANGGFGRISWAVVQHDVVEAETIDGFVQAATPPTVGVPVVGRAVAVVASRTNKHSIVWRATVGNTGAVTDSRAWVQVDGHAFVSVKLASATATSFSLVTVVGHRYRIAVRATAGTTVGTGRYSATFAG